MPQTKSIETRAAQDFLKTVYMLQTQSDRVSTHRLAEVLSISAPSVSDMAARLSADGLIDYRKYYGVRLTEAGASIAQAVMRRHERIEQFLVHDLGYTADEAHCEAELMEHAVSNRLVDALEHKLLTQPKTCAEEKSDIMPETD